MPRDWEEVRITVIRPGPIPTSSPCGNTIPDDDRLTVLLPSGNRLVPQAYAHKVLTICLLNDKWYWMLLLVYSVQIYGPLSPSMSWEGCDLHPSLWVHTLSGCKQRSQRSSRCYPFCGLCKINSFCQCPHPFSQRSSCTINFSLLPHWSFQISLIPQHSSMEMFNAGDPTANSRKQTYERYRCHDSTKTVSRNLMSNTCSKLISSMSAIINDGALRECLWLTFSWTSGYVTLHSSLVWISKNCH